MTIADALVAKRYVVLSEKGGELTVRGRKFMAQFGANLAAPTGQRRIFCRTCLDSSERRHHVAALVGAEIWRRCLVLGWVARQRDSRAVRLTPAGRRGLRETFGVTLDFDARPGR